MAVKWHHEHCLWYTLNRRREIVLWIHLVSQPDGHEYRPYAPSQDRKGDGPQWVELPPCQTLAEAKRAVKGALSSRA